MQRGLNKIFKFIKLKGVLLIESQNKIKLQTFAAFSWLLWNRVLSKTMLLGLRALDSSLYITCFNTVPKFSVCWLANSLQEKKGAVAVSVKSIELPL